MKLKTYAHFLWHALRLKFDAGHRAPLSMNIQLTHRCANNCRYCFYDRNESEEMDASALRKILREAWDMGARRVNFSGGEPLLREDLYEIVESAKEEGFFVGISTKGARAAEQLRALKLVDRVMLSYDGPDDVREFLYGKNGAEETREALEIFHAQGVPYWTTTVLTTVSIPHIDWIVEQARIKNSVANFVLLHTQPWEGIRFHPKAEQVRDILPSEDQTRSAVRHLIAMKKRGAAVGSSMPYLEQWLAWPDYLKICSPESSPLYSCMAGRAFCELMADGTLYPCGWMRGVLPGVSVTDHGFAEAFQSLPEIPDCKSCVSSCWLESNLIFSLNPRTVLNWLRYLLRN